LEATKRPKTVSLSRYTLVVSAIVASSLLLVWGLGPRRLDVMDRWAALYGGALALLNTVGAYSLVLWSDRCHTTSFLRTILWGTLGRMAALLVGVVVGILALGLPRMPLIVSLLSYFLVFFVIQTTMLHRRAPTAPREAL
jgi:hypothetical protein